jgi:predicted nucleic acid-binding protein
MDQFSDISKTDYIFTGDRDLLSLNPFGKTGILTPSDFEIILSTL